jgi:hypothetical protein
MEAAMTLPVQALELIRPGETLTSLRQGCDAVRLSRAGGGADTSMIDREIPTLYWKARAVAETLREQRLRESLQRWHPIQSDAGRTLPRL